MIYIKHVLFQFQVMGDSSKKTREATCLKAIAINRLGGFKIPVDIDPQSGRVSGPNGAKFGSYFGVLAQSKVSILVPDWDHVTEEEKDLIWQDLCVSNKFIGYNNYIMNYFVVCFMTYLFIFQTSFEFESSSLIRRSFKVVLTTTYVYGKHKGQSPCEKYGIDEDT